MSDDAKTTDLAAKGASAPEGEERAAILVDTIAALPAEAFTKAGPPKVKAVEAAVGFDVTGEELSALWEEIQVSDENDAPVATPPAGTKISRSMIRITSKVPGFRRGGMAHPAEPTEWPLEIFTDEQLDQIEVEPNLIVERLEVV